MGINGLYDKKSNSSTTGGVIKMGDNNTNYSGINEKNQTSSSSSSSSRVIINGVIIVDNDKEKLKKEDESEHLYDQNPDEYSKFPIKVQYNDLLFVILFIIQMILFIVLAVNAYCKIIKNGENEYIVRFFLQGLLYLVISVPLLLIFFIVWKRIFKIHPTNMIYTSFFSLVVMVVLLIGILFGNGFIYWAIFVVLFLVYIVCFFFSYRDKIPFVGKMISLVLGVIEKYPSTLVVSFISLMISSIYWNVWLLTVLYYQGYLFIGGSGGSHAFNWIKYIFLYFNLYWTHNVITYCCHSVVSGVSASWYFFADEQFNNMPANPCAASLYRSTTTSFGSIVLGSLLVCIVQIIQFILRLIFRVNFLNFLCCITISIFKRMLYTFNTYTFSMVSIYGQSFCKSSKKTWTLMENNSEKLFTTHNYMYITLLSVSLSMFLIIGFSVYMILALLNINPDTLTIQVFFFCFIIWKPFDVIFSSTITILMCLISDPNAMQITKPITFNQLNEFYNNNNENEEETI